MAYVEPYYVEADYFVPDDLALSDVLLDVTVDGIAVTITYGDIVNATTVTFTDKELLR